MFIEKELKIYLIKVIKLIYFLYQKNTTSTIIENSKCAIYCKTPKYGIV